MSNSNTNNPDSDGEPNGNPVSDYLDDQNWCEYPKFFRKIGDLEKEQKILIEQLLKKQSMKMPSFEPTYFQNGAFLILGDSKHMKEHVYCGKQTSPNKPGACNHPIWCPRCAAHQAYKLQKRFLLTAYNYPLQSLTVTFQRSISLDGPNHQDIRQIYDAFADAAREMVDTGSWNGVFMKHEVAIAEFVPLELVIHTHAIVHADPITEMQMQSFSDAFKRRVRVIMEERNSGLNYLAKTIDEQKGLYYNLNYMSKAVQIWPKYQAAWQNSIATGEQSAEALNKEVYGLVHGLEECLKGLRRTHAFGTLHAANPEYIGLPSADRIRRAEEIEEVVRDIRSEFNKKQARKKWIEARQGEADLLGLNPDDKPDKNI
jgi:hypothetical protein